MGFAACPGSLYFGIQIQTRVCDIELGLRKEKGEGKIPPLCQLLVDYDIFWTKTLWQGNFLCSIVDSIAPDQAVHTSAFQH